MARFIRHISRAGDRNRAHPLFVRNAAERGGTRRNAAERAAGGRRFRSIWVCSRHRLTQPLLSQPLLSQADTATTVTVRYITGQENELCLT